MWQDALCNIKRKDPKDYKWISIVLITMSNALNISTVWILFKILFRIRLLVFDEMVFSEISKVDNLIKFFLQFYLVPLVINYFLIFHNHKDTLLLQQYENRYKGKLFAAYILVSIFAWIASFVLFYVHL